MFRITWLKWNDDSTQSVWNFHMSLEWQTWVYNGENNIKNCSIEQCEKSVKKKMKRYRK